MLHVRANSWHYWVWALGRGRSSYDGKMHSQPKNLCKYFWHIVLKITVAALIFGLAFAGIGFVALVVYSFPMQVGFGIALLALAIVLFIGAGYAVGMAVDRRHASQPERQNRKFERRQARRLAEEARKGKPPGTLRLIWTFIKAKKQKYCPLINVVDE